MALDASIYGQLDTQAPLRLSQMIREANNPMAQAQQMLSLKQMLQQGKLQELQMQQAQAEMAQKAEDRAATRAALADFVAANPDMAQAARMSPQDAVKYFFDQMKAKNAPPDFIVAGDSVLQKPRTAGESLQPAYSVPGKPQLVERADPKDPLRTQKVWMRPGETDGPVAGLGVLPDILDPRVQEFQLRKARAGASSVNVGAPVLEREEDKAKGKLNVDAYGALRDSANASRTLNAHLDIQQRKLDNGFETGWGTEAKAAAAGMLGALGVKDAERYASDAQSFKAASMEVVLQKQLAQKGPQTESDALRIQQTGSLATRRTQTDLSLPWLARRTTGRSSSSVSLTTTGENTAPTKGLKTHGIPARAGNRCLTSRRCSRQRRRRPDPSPARPQTALP